MMGVKTKLSDFEFVDVWIGLFTFVFVHLLEEFGALVELYVRLRIEVVLVLFDYRFGLEFGQSSILNLLIQLFLDLLFLSLPRNTLVFQSLSFIVLLFLRFEFCILFGRQLSIFTPHVDRNLLLAYHSLCLGTYCWTRRKMQVGKRI